MGICCTNYKNKPCMQVTAQLKVFPGCLQVLSHSCVQMHIAASGNASQLLMRMWAAACRLNTACTVGPCWVPNEPATGTRLEKASVSLV
jgi:hypothetical protein